MARPRGAGMMQLVPLDTTESLLACMGRSPQLWHELETTLGGYRVPTGEHTTGARLLRLPSGPAGSSFQSGRLAPGDRLLSGTAGAHLELPDR